MAFGEQTTGRTMTEMGSETAERPVRARRPRGPFGTGLILAGLTVVLVFGGGVSAWTATAPIDGAVVAPGVVSVSSRRKLVQHLEGGIVETIDVQDGDAVAAGDVLLRLRSVGATSDYRRFLAERLELRAEIARLEAEQEGAETLSFPDSVLGGESGPDAAAIRRDQERIFLEHASVRAEQDRIAANEIAEIEHALNSARRQVGVLNRVRAITVVERSKLTRGLASGTPRGARLLELERQLEENRAALLDARGEVAVAKNAIARIHSRRREARAAELAVLAEEIRAKSARLWQVEQRLAAADDVLTRTEIVSPIDGVVVNLAAHTIGGVIPAGAPILEVVPSDDELIIDAYVDPTDIVAVRPGGPANVELTTQSRRRRTPLTGTVLDVSADRVGAGPTGGAYYLARVRLDPDSLEDFDGQLLAGMGAEVFFRTGPRTFVEYMLSPISRSIQRGMREE